MQKIKVAKKEQKPTSTGGTMVALYDEKNTRFSAFIPELKTVQEGDVVELEVEVKGKYNNITAFKVLEHGLPPPIEEQEQEGGQKKPWQGGRDSPEQRASIETQVAAKIVAELWIAGKVFPADPILGALYHWLCEKLGIKDETQGKPSPAPAKPLESQPGGPISDMAENARAEEGLPPKPTEATKPFDLKKFMEEFTPTRENLATAGLYKWEYDVLLARLSEMTGVSARTIPAAISRLTDAQRETLASELKKDFQEAQ